MSIPYERQYSGAARTFCTRGVTGCASAWSVLVFSHIHVPPLNARPRRTLVATITAAITKVYYVHNAEALDDKEAYTYRDLQVRMSFLL